MSTLFEKLGGYEAVNQVVEKFYERVFNDDRIKHFFDGMERLKQKAHLRDFLIYAFEGAARYPGSSMREAHKRLVEQGGLSDEHFDAFTEDFAETLLELGVSPDLMAEAMAVASSVEHRHEVLNRNPSEKFS